MFEKISFHYLKLLKIWHNSLKYATNQQINSLFHNTFKFFLWTRICKLKKLFGEQHVFGTKYFLAQILLEQLFSDQNEGIFVSKKLDL